MAPGNSASRVVPSLSNFLGVFRDFSSPLRQGGAHMDDSAAINKSSGARAAAGRQAAAFKCALHLVSEL
jgi:hypothetical protein